MTKEFPIQNIEAFKCEALKRAGRSPRFNASTLRRITVSLLVISVLVFIIRLYRWTVSPALIFLFGPTGGCRFTPSCSQYAVDAIRSRGVLAGGWLAARRICRCHPWGDCGHDPAPEKEFGIRPSALRFDAAHIAACHAEARREGGNSEFGI